MRPEIPSSFTVTDILLSCIYTGLILFFCWLIKLKNKEHPYYKFFLPGIYIKLFGTLSFSLIYVYYYKEGDALNYFYSSKLLSTLLVKEPLSFLKILFLGDVSYENLFKFDSHFLLPMYTNDKFTFFFIRLITPLNIISFGNFFCCSILLSAITYSGIWKLYVVFCEQFPALTKQMAIAILFIPSVIFWGSGLLKDTLTISALGWFIFALHRLISSKKTTRYLLYLFISGFFLLSVKPYILYSIVGASSVWIASFYLKKIKIPLERYVYAPIIISFFFLISFLLIIRMSKEQDRFAIQTTGGGIIAKQSVSDAKSSFYKEPVENSFIAILRSVPSTIHLTLFRPYVWEANSILSVLASLESLFLLQFFIWLLIKFKIVFLFPQIFKDPFVTFCFFFILILSFVVGFSTDNFGTLDRFRIPVLPFYLALCFILHKQSRSLEIKKDPVGI